MASSFLSRSFGLGGVDTQAGSQFSFVPLFLGLWFILFVLAILVAPLLARSQVVLPFDCADYTFAVDEVS